MVIDIDEKMFSPAVITAAAGCKPVTFRAWRNRNGLFPETKQVDGKWNRFSLVDTCVARAVVMLIAHGLEASDAVFFAQDIDPNPLRFKLGELLQGSSDINAVVGFHRGVPPAAQLVYDEDSGKVEKAGNFPPPRVTFPALDDKKPLSEVMRETSGTLTLLDLHTVISHVLNFLVENGHIASATDE